MKGRFSVLAWLFLGYLIAVILFGAWVRIAGAGAGCGNHWPLCNGEAIPPAPETKTLIEYTHRITSALCGLFGIAMVWLAPRAHRRMAIAALVFILIEGFIGAVLVKKELVANDASLSRAIVIALHLTNTLLLTASAAAMTVEERRASAGRAALRAALAVIVVVSATGAVTALGDTLFPKQAAMDGSLWAQIRDDATSSQHFLIRLRALHPFLAVAGAAFLIGGLSAFRRRERWLSHWPISLAGTQVLIGVANIALAAPGWMQIVHLLVAQGLWVACVRAYVGARPI